jgi:3-isopropylmalate/(R)-2-methylmalate dehydratase small subunit
MEPITAFTSKVIPLPVDNVDTDQIIPARFLKAIDKSGMGDNLFADWRYEADGTPKPDFVLNRPEMTGRMVLLAGDNFGAGSSREHAPWALVGYGIRAVLSTSFADIFKGNALKNGLLPIVVDQATSDRLFAMLEADPDTEVTVDLERQVVTVPGGEVEFTVDPFSRSMLLQGTDELGYLLGHDEQIAAYEAAHPARIDTVASAR